jgi:hypothetical protein
LREALIGSWAGVGVNFVPLLYAGQHANEKIGPQFACWAGVALITVIGNRIEKMVQNEA